MPPCRGLSWIKAAVSVKTTHRGADPPNGHEGTILATAAGPWDPADLGLRSRAEVRPFDSIKPGSEHVPDRSQMTSIQR